MPSRIDDSVLLADVILVAKKLGHTPLTLEYTAHGRFSLECVRQRWGKWKAVCLAANLPPTKGRGGHNRIPNDELFLRVQKIYQELKRQPQPADYKLRYGHPVVIYRRWESWSTFLDAANIPSDRQAMIQDLRRVYKLLCHTPTFVEYKMHGQFPISRVLREFDKWAEACIAAALTPHTTHEGGPHRVPVHYYIRLYDKKQIRFQGSYELRFAQYLDRREYEWLAHGEFPAISYTDSIGKVHKYMPDFYVPELDVYYETKGWFRLRDQRKMAAVRIQHPDIHIVVVTRDLLHQFLR